MDYIAKKELKNLTIDEFMKIGENHCTAMLHTAPCDCVKTECPFYKKWSCDVYTLMCRVQETEYNKEYIVPGFGGLR